jgi:hypothetical protein
MTVRPAWQALVLALAAAHSACITATPYRAYRDRIGGAGATIAFPGGFAAQPGRPQLIIVDVYGYDTGCPDVGNRSGNGYHGSVGADTGGAGPIVVPADEPVVLKALWVGPAGRCESLLVVRPQSGRYVFGPAPPEPHGPMCGSSLWRDVPDDAGATRVERADPSPQVPLRRGSRAHNLEYLCELSALRRDHGGRPDDTAREPPSPPTVVASAQVAKQPERPPIRPVPPNRRASLGLRLGVSFGGETLATGQLSNGDELTLTTGKGAFTTLEAMFTPLWIGDWLGVGVGAEVGFMSGSISASNGDISFSRFPVIATAHVMLRTSHQWYLLGGGGVRRDLSPSVSGSGFGSGVGASFESRWGGVAQAGAYFALNEHLGFDGLFRLTLMSYGIQGQTLDATNGGVSAAFHVNF